MGRGMVILLSLLSGAAGFAAELSGAWETSLAWGETLVPTSVLTLNLRLADWSLTSTWTFSELSLSGTEFVLEGDLGALGIAAGVAFHIPGGVAPVPMGPMGFSLDGVEFLGGYISLELSLGNLTLRFTLQGAPPRSHP